MFSKDDFLADIEFQRVNNMSFYNMRYIGAEIHINEIYKNIVLGYGYGKICGVTNHGHKFWVTLYNYPDVYFIVESEHLMLICI